MKLAKDVVKVPLRFDDEGEDIWTSDPAILLQDLHLENLRI